MKIQDEDFKRIFGTDSSVIEPAPKATTQKLTGYQQQAKLIVERPELFSPNPKRKRSRK